MNGRDRRASRVATFPEVFCRRVVGALLSVALMLTVACSDDDAAGSPVPTGAAVPAATSTPTTVPSATTTAATTTTTTTTPTTSTTTTTTTSAPPGLDDLDDLVDLEAEVAAAYDEVYEGYWACLRAPLECDTSWLVEGSGSAEAMQNTMQALADRARYVGDDPVGYYVIESIEFDDTLTEATVTSCWWSTAVLYTTPIDPSRPPGPDNPPTVVNDIPGTSVQTDQLRRLLGAWSVFSSTTDESVARENRCA